MFCDNERCPFDLWAPAGGAIMNRAFSGYAMHQSELDDIVNTILQESYNGNTDFSISISTELSNSDLNYIKEQVTKRGLVI